MVFEKKSEAAKDLGQDKTEYMTLQVYGESINHATDFKYLGS